MFYDSLIFEISNKGRVGYSLPKSEFKSYSIPKKLLRETTPFASTEEHMQFCANDIRGLMDEVRSHADALESEVADELWPLPKYQEMLFIR